MLSPEAIQQVKDNILLNTAKFVSDVNKEEGFDPDFSTPITIQPWYNGGHNISFENTIFVAATRKESRGVLVDLRRFQGLRLYIVPIATVTTSRFTEEGRLIQTRSRSTLMDTFEERIRIVRKNEEVWEPESIVKNQYSEALKRCWDIAQSCILSDDRTLAVIKYKSTHP